MAAGHVADQRLEGVGVAGAGVEAERERPLDARGLEIQTDHPAPRGLEQLHGDLADEAEADHADALAQLRRRATHALQRDGADGRRRGLLQIAPGRDAAHQISRHVDVFRVRRLPGPGGRHQIAGREIGDAVADRHDFARH